MKLLIALLFPVVASAQSITDLPEIAKLMVHHFDCRVAILPASGDAKELNFQIDPNVAGHQQTDFTLVSGADKVVASANAQMLAVVWTRGNDTIANSQAWVQKSTSQAMVLMVADPKDENNQVHLNCSAVTFDQVKK